MRSAPPSPNPRRRLSLVLGWGRRRVRRRFAITVRALHAVLLIAYGLTLITLVVAGAVGVGIRPDAFWPIGLGTLLVLGLTSIPLSRWLGQALDQLITGWPDDPYRTLNQVQAELLADPSPQAIIPAMLASITATLDMPYAAITSLPDGATASVGLIPVGAERITIPLTYGATAVGALEVAARRPYAVLSASELHLLHDLARQIGITLHAAQISEALQAARAQLVAAREEERRRMRRDLHDGLGPTLAALRLQLGAVRRTLRADPDAAEALLDDLRADVAETTAAIRRLVYDLRPPLLDEHGLSGTLRSLSRLIEPQALRITLPEELPALPAAVEVAVYRIAAEALLNVARHAHPSHCTLDVTITATTLELRVADQGVGLPAGHREGVGIAGMRERAEELGGSLQIDSAPGAGVTVVAYIPWSSAV